MQVDWKIFGKKAVVIAVFGVALTTAILIVRHVKKQREEKKAEENEKDENKETNKKINKKLVEVATEDDLQQTAKDLGEA